MALTQDELDQVYNYVMGKGQSLAGLPDGGSDLSSMYLAPLLKYSPGGKATLVRLAVSVLKGDSAYQVWVNEPGNAGKTLSDFFLSIKGAKGDPFTFADFTPEQLADLALTYEKLTPEQKEEMKLHFGDLTEADILILQKPATDAADEVREQMVQISQDVSQALTASGNATKAANDAAKLAGDSTIKANEAAGLANTAAGNADRATESAETAADKANASAEIADENAGLANTAAGNADKATGKANTAADRSNALSDHRDEIRDGYWWRWNETTGEWYNTGEIAKGNVMYAVFDVDPATGELSMSTDDEYTGASFELNNEGILSVII